MVKQKQEISVKVLDGPAICEARNGVDMVKYRFVCTQPHIPPNKVTIYMTRLQDQQQPDVVNVVAEQLKWILMYGGRPAPFYGLNRGGMLRPCPKM